MACRFLPPIWHASTPLASETERVHLTSLILDEHHGSLGTQGPVSCICIPPARGIERSCLSAGGLFLSGAVGGDIKIWDYQVSCELTNLELLKTAWEFRNVMFKCV
eukprot:1147899-Pelagomonas_calceolata.AAC.7